MTFGFMHASGGYAVAGIVVAFVILLGCVHVL